MTEIHMMNGSQEHAAVDNARRLAAETEAEQRELSGRRGHFPRPLRECDMALLMPAGIRNLPDRLAPRGDSAGVYRVMARANNSVGQTQAEKLIFNPAGSHNNVIRPLTVNVL
jgi:hypothetical protein